MRIEKQSILAIPAERSSSVNVSKHLEATQEIPPLSDRKAEPLALEYLESLIITGYVDRLKELLTPAAQASYGYIPMDLALDRGNSYAIEALVDLDVPVKPEHEVAILQFGITKRAENHLKTCTSMSPNEFSEFFSNAAMAYKMHPTQNILDYMDSLVEVYQRLSSTPYQYLPSVIMAIFGGEGMFPEFAVIEKRLFDRQYEITGEIGYFSALDENFILKLIEHGYVTINSSVMFRIVSFKFHTALNRALEVGVSIPPSALNEAVRAKDFDAVALLMRYQAPISDNLLAIAIRTNDRNIVDRVVEYGAKIGKEQLDDLVGLAIQERKSDCLALCLQHGATITKRDLQLAITYGDIQALDYLTDHANVRLDSYVEFLCANAGAMFAFICANGLESDLSEVAVTKLCTVLPEDQALSVIRTHKNVKIKADNDLIDHLICEKKFNLLELVCETNQFKHQVKINDLFNAPNRDQLKRYVGSHLEVDLGDSARMVVDAQNNGQLNECIAFMREVGGGNVNQEIISRLLTAMRQLPSTLNREFDITRAAKLMMLNPTINDQQACVLAIGNWMYAFPSFNPHSSLMNYSPWGFDVDVYNQLLPLVKEAASREGDSNPELNAYKLTVAFGSLEKAKKYLGKFQTQERRERPIHDACLFELPKTGIWDYAVWRHLIEKFEYSPKIMNLLALAPNIEDSINGPFTPYRVVNERILEKGVKLGCKDHYYREFLKLLDAHPKFGEAVKEAYKLPRGSKEQRQALNCLMWTAAEDLLMDEVEEFKKTVDKIDSKNPPLGRFFDEVAKRRNFESKTPSSLLDTVVRSIYGITDPQYHDFAIECAKAGFKKEDFKLALDIIGKGPKKLSYIPNIKINGADIGYPGYKFETMSHTDPMMFVLGKKTGCCQSLNGHSRDCVLHGATQAYGGFVTLKKNGADNPFVAQSWVGLTADGELVFDSIEHNIGQDRTMIMKFYEKAAEEMLKANPKLKRVLYGGGGNTPKDRDYGYRLLPRPSEGYSPIIGYKAAGYDSTDKRFILAEQTKKMGQVDGEMDWVVVEGVDTIISAGKKRRGLALNAVQRASFFQQMPDIRQKLESHPQNPLLEEGYFDKVDTRQHIGEHFLPFALVQEIVDRKINKDESTHIVLVDNNIAELKEKLAAIDLKEGQRVLIGYVHGVHTTAGYIEIIEGKCKLQVIDSEPTSRNSAIYDAACSVWPQIDYRINTERLQLDFYSCSTFAIKALIYFSKHGQEMLLRNKATLPAPLLKMGQDASQIEASKMEDIVSFKKGLTLGKYLEIRGFQDGKRRYNAAAIRAKYRWLRQLSGPGPKTTERLRFPVNRIYRQRAA